ncbi:hypothetical protein K503DRAFT_781245 [Rhizopogon vinicolor AM-OR11-026]|uniref:Uncharacterized protein n=1 Tax=Rhizopogon vinicolor AM-OR11-026 TaxID=1314800 RepID=A0A1B7N738_9AGAM|nr:hypothetical protein K503DRAFT_781245 [Rhizopogon vinicolor AM-OR11-026]
MATQLTDTIVFPKNCTAYIFGTATSGTMQEVKVKVQDTDGDDENECTFKALNRPLVVTGGGLGFMDQEAVVITADGTDDRQLEIIFKALGSDGKPQMMKGFKKDKHVPVNWVTNYTYCTEDSPAGGDDYHDTTLVVSFINM